MPPYRSLEEYNIEITNEVKERYSHIINEIGEDDLSNGGVNLTREELADREHIAARSRTLCRKGRVRLALLGAISTAICVGSADLKGTRDSNIR